MAFKKMHICVLIFFLCYDFVAASHFRSTTYSWLPISSDGTNHVVRFTYRFAWRRSAFTRCTAAVIANRSPLYYGGTWYLYDKNGNVIFGQSAAVACTEFDAQDDWFVGTMVLTKTFYGYGENNFDFGLQSCCWLGGLANGGGSFVFRGYNIDMNKRSDSGEYNSSPIIQSLPFKKIELGCPLDFTVKTADANAGDVVSCRYASGYAECGGVCTPYQHFSFNESTCTFTYDGLGNTGEFIAVAIMIEDHPNTTVTLGNRVVTPSESISTIPFQFLVQIVDNSPSCVFPILDPPPFGSLLCTWQPDEFTAVLTAGPSAPGLSIETIIILGPVGLTKGMIIKDPGADIYSIQVHWQPAVDQIGMHLICFSARDSSGSVSEQQCYEHNVEVPDGTSRCSSISLDPLPFERSLCSHMDSEFSATIIVAPSEPNEVLELVFLGITGYQVAAPVVDPTTGKYSFDVTWTPTVAQVGTHNICVHAKNPAGEVSNLECYQHNVYGCDTSNYDIGVTNGAVTCDCQPSRYRCSYACQNGYRTQDTDNVDCPDQSTIWMFSPQTCEDINECTDTTFPHNCHADATCSNQVSSFTCTCDSGYTGNGVSCNDINECTTTDTTLAHTCDADATCSNNIGSYSCSCNSGYAGDGFTCTEIDECTDSTFLHNCHDNATCANTIGSFTCTCKQGFVGDGVNCIASCVNPVVKFARTNCIDGFLMGSKCTYTCDSDKMVIEENETIECIPNGFDGRGIWNSIYPVCKFSPACPGDEEPSIPTLSI